MRIKMDELRKLKNIGKELIKQLNNVEIFTYNELVNVGSQEAWLRIKKIDPSACINRLLALEGAIQNVRWHDLTDSEKRRLKDFYEENK